jgi:hypothetical protein
MVGRYGQAAAPSRPGRGHPVNAWHASALGENCDIMSLKRVPCSAARRWPTAGLHAGRCGHLSRPTHVLWPLPREAVASLHPWRRTARRGRRPGTGHHGSGLHDRVVGVSVLFSGGFTQLALTDTPSTFVAPCGRDDTKNNSGLVRFCHDELSRNHRGRSGQPLASMWLALDADADGLQRLAHGITIGWVPCVS